MNVTICLESSTSERGQNTSKENPVFIDQQYTFMSFIYVHGGIIEENPQLVIDQLMSYMNQLPVIDVLTVPSVFMKEPYLSCIQNVKKKGLTIQGDYVLTQDDYERLKETKIHVKSCSEEIKDQPNLFLTGQIDFQSDLFAFPSISSIRKQFVLNLEKPLSSLEKSDIKLFFEWNRNLEVVNLTSMTAREYVETVQFLKPYLEKIPKIKIEVEVKNDSHQDLRKLFEIMGEHSKKVQVYYGTHILETKDKGNSCSLEEYITMDEILTFYKQEIEKNHYSPLEQFIYAYDIVKNADYQASINKSESRDLHTVVLGGKIVCVGYSSLLGGLLTKLGIPSKEFGVDRYKSATEEEGHQRIAVYLQDEKYGINGFFVCDPTWDCRTELDLGYNSPIDRYNYFLLPYDQMNYKKTPENINEISMLSLPSYLPESELQDFYEEQFITMNHELGMIDTTAIESQNGISNHEIYEYLKEQIKNYKQVVPFNTIATAIETVRRTEGMYETESELKENIEKIKDLHSQFRSLAFQEHMSVYIRQNEMNQIINIPVLEDNITRSKIA